LRRPLAEGAALFRPTFLLFVPDSAANAQCHIGIVALDPRHKTHNIPGKFLSYMQGGLPVLASINPGNDLAHLIARENVGRACTDHSVDTLQRLAEDLVDEMALGQNVLFDQDNNV
jgi:hypothetical protein